MDDMKLIAHAIAALGRADDSKTVPLGIVTLPVVCNSQADLDDYFRSMGFTRGPRLIPPKPVIYVRLPDATITLE